MGKRVTWKSDAVVSLSLREDLHTLAQMLRSPAMRFYNILSNDGKWSKTDLADIDPLFTVLVGRVVLQRLVDTKVSDKLVKASPQSCERRWIRARLNFDGGSPFKGGDLIEIGREGSVDTTQAIIIKENLSIASDREIIERCELTNMWGDDDIRERLIHFFDCGNDRDLFKEEVFPGYL